MDVKNKVWDFIIVGAGVLGCSTAKYLKESQPSAEILVVDKFSAAGQGNTIKSNAAFRNIFDTELNIKICTASIAYYKELERQGTDLELQDVGYLWLLSKEQYNARTQKTMKVSNSEDKISFIDFLTAHQVDHEFYSFEQLQEILPSATLQFSQEEKDELRQSIGLHIEDVTHGFLGKLCGTLSPDLLVRSYEHQFKELGGTTMYNTEVEKILLKDRNHPFDPDYIHTVWKDAEVGAIEIRNVDSNETSVLQTKNLLLATGAWINQLLDPLGINSSIKAKKRQLFTAYGFESFVKNTHFPNKFQSIPFLILPVGGVFVKPVPKADGVVLGTSDVIGREFAWNKPDSEKDLSNQRLDFPNGELDFYLYNILPVLEAYFPSVFDETVRIHQPSAGMYAYSLDKFPVIEQIDLLGNLFFVSGASGSGIMKADAIGRIATALVNNNANTELFDGTIVKTADFSLSKRNLPKETLIL